MAKGRNPGGGDKASLEDQLEEAHSIGRNRRRRSSTTEPNYVDEVEPFEGGSTDEDEYAPEGSKHGHKEELHLHIVQEPEPSYEPLHGSTLHPACEQARPLILFDMNGVCLVKGLAG